MSKTTTNTNVTDTPIEGGSVQTRTTVTRTTYESEVPVYRPMLNPRTTIINRTSYAAPEKKSSVSSVVRTIQSTSNIAPEAYSNLTRTGVANVKNDREKEKKDMQDLNERLGGYIEKVRFLEAQNRKLVDELDKLKQKWGKETGAIKAMYQAELDEARKLLDEAEKEKARLEIKCASLEEQIEELRRKLDEDNQQVARNKDKLQRQDQQLSDYENELAQLRKRCESLENDRDKDKKDITRLQDALNRARVDLDNETLNHVDAENRRQTLEEEIEFLKQVQEQEMKELQALAYRDTTQENRDFWKNEMANCLRDIQQAYEDKTDEMRLDLERYYNMKIQEFRTGAARQNVDTVTAKEESKKLRENFNDLRKQLAEAEARNAQLEKELDALRREYALKEREWDDDNNRLKAEVAQLRAEMEAILKELQDLMDAKLGLELEIAAYRKLLESEENRLGLKDVVANMLGKKDGDGRQRPIRGGEGSGTGESAITPAKQPTSESAPPTSRSGSKPSSGQGQDQASAGKQPPSTPGKTDDQDKNKPASASAAAAGDKSGQDTTDSGKNKPADTKSADANGKPNAPASDAADKPAEEKPKEPAKAPPPILKGEISAKTTFSRSAKGPLQVSECSSDGKFVVVENTGKKEEQLQNWRIKRVVDGNEKADYLFEAPLALKPATKAKVFSKGNLPAEHGPNDYESSVATWGIGANIVTKLVNPNGEERATHTQKTTYS